MRIDQDLLPDRRPVWKTGKNPGNSSFQDSDLIICLNQSVCAKDRRCKARLPDAQRTAVWRIYSMLWLTILPSTKAVWRGATTKITDETGITLPSSA